MKKILGIDVGGTKIATALVDTKFGLTDVRVVPTSQTDLVKQLVEIISSYEGYSAIGLAVPGQVLSNGMVLKLPNIPSFKPKNMKSFLSKKFKTEVSVMNDAKAFALAEATIGAGKGNKVVAGIILGTGVGVGVVMDGQVYFGKDGIAGELEHIVLPDGKMLRFHRKAAGVLRKKEDARKILNTLVSSVVLSFNPDIMVLGGGWGKLPGMDKLIASLAKDSGNYHTKTVVKLSKLKYPGIVGGTLFWLRGLKK